LRRPDGGLPPAVCLRTPQIARAARFVLQFAPRKAD
jgi:hypothetical protein